MPSFSPAFLRRARSGTVSVLRSSAISGAELGLVGALVQSLHLPPDRVRMRSEGSLIQVGFGPRLCVEVAVSVGAAPPHRRNAPPGLAEVGRGVAGRKNHWGGVRGGGGPGPAR